MHKLNIQRNFIRTYCFDTNVFIEPWNKYYSMKNSPDYWTIIDNLAKEGIVFSPKEVQREIEKKDDNLNKWLKTRPYFFREINHDIQIALRHILEKFPRIVDTKKDRSMADPWVIAYAIVEDAVVVTKEAPAPKKFHIPDVCKELSVRCIDDYIFISELGIKFSAKIE